MSTLSDTEQLRSEHAALLQAYGRIQADCSLRLRRQAERIDHLENALFQTRLAVVLRDTRMAWAEADQQALREAAQLPRRKTLARQVEQLMERVRTLARQRNGGSRAVLCVGSDGNTVGLARQLVESTGGRFLTHEGEEEALEASLRAADLVICQTGCISHDAYWRVRDHCKRTGKQCVLVDSPEAVIQPPTSRKPA
ncbi:DUF2325 domain-containing protein [Bordetella genomosp. 12]|uniref:DUF2325 domain-containing protein n=1 Tax=Bordetella genomosp. 12 TaxID=463035 RepID=A0A261VB55_9BORD|nr:DUF2325 domain-containing protein [Bordetella genomosp. 12]OZI71225.1 DUF2325 domain-containing protein [Bordetella genomosp. 12]